MGAFRGQSLAKANLGTAGPTTVGTAGQQVGDLLVITVMQEGSYNDVYTPPAGWNALGPWRTHGTGADNAGAELHAFWRIATAADVGASYTVTHAQARSRIVSLIAYSGAWVGSPIAAATIEASGSNSSIICPGLTTTKAKALLLRTIVKGNQNTNVVDGTAMTPPAGHTERLDTNTSNDGQHGIAELFETTAGAKASATYGYTNTNGFGAIGASLAFQENSAPPAPGIPTVTPNPVNTTGTIAWTAGSDPDGDALVYDVDLSTNGGSTWKVIRTDGAGTSFVYDFTAEPATTAAQVRVRSQDTSGLTSSWATSANFTIAHNTAPTAPTLVAPANGSTVDLAAGYTFSLTPQDPDTGDSTVAYVFRRKVAGAGSYEFWNASLASWQTTEVWNTITAVPKGSSLQVTFASGKWLNQTTYNWSARTRDAQGVDGPFASDFTVTANKPPTVDVLSPAGTVTTTSRPVTSWSYTDPENDPQAAYEAKVFTAAQYGAAGFDPATSPAVWSSGTVTSQTARDVQPTVDFNEGTQYRAYVRARQNVGAVWSAWDWSLFTVALERPLAPLLVITPEPTTSRVRLDLAGTDDGVPFSASNTTFDVEFSDDNGQLWTGVRGGTAVKPSAGFAATIYDLEAPPGAQRLYRARTVGDV